MVIHRNSKHPVLVKKIALKIWLLREEIENVIKNRMIYAKKNNLECDISDIKAEYSGVKENAAPTADTVLHNLKKQPTGEANNEIKEKIETSENENSPEDDLAAQMEASLDKDVDTTEEGKEGEEKEVTEEGEDTNEEGKTEEAKEEEEEEKTIDDEEDLEKQMATSLEEEVDTGQEEKTADGEEENAEQPKDDSTKILQRVLNLEKSSIHTGKTILAEIFMDKIFLFSDKNFFEGQSIVIEFQIPSKFTLNADVIFCNKFNLKNRIISKHNLSYRVCAKFTFLKKGEMTLLRKFLNSVEPEVEHEKEKKKEEGEDSGGIDDVLDGLDL